MIYVWVTFLIVFNLFWLASVIFALPGNWLMVISTAFFAWWHWEDGVFSVYTLIAITALAVVGEVLEFFGGMGGARRAGATWRGSFGAIMGAMIGAVLGTFLIPVPIFGTLLGTCFGAGLGTCLLELAATKQMDQSLRSGLGAGVGVFIGTTSKFIVGILIWLVIAVAAYWP